MKVIVIGGGISGLASALQLTQEGQEVVLVEASDQLGGLGTFFESKGRLIDRFYHCIMPTDAALLSVIDAVGLADTAYWKPTSMGFAIGGERFAFNTPMDLLRFKPLTAFQRLRLGAVSLAFRHLSREKELDDTRTEDWLIRFYGEAIWRKVWEPLFRSKFGPAVGDVPALYLYRRLGREGNRSTRGYLTVGHQGLIDSIATRIREQGGGIRLRTAVEHLDVTADGRISASLGDGSTVEANWAISTVPLPLLRTICASGMLESRLPDVELQYQGVVNVLFFLKRPLEGYYWTPVIDSGTDFDGVVEMSTLIETNHYGGRYLVYVMKYTDRDSPLFHLDDKEIGERWLAQFLDLYSDVLSEADVDEVRVFRAPFVEPVFPLGYLRQKPPLRVDGTPLILATTAQVYPNVTSWNSSVRLAMQAVSVILDQSADASVPSI